MGMPVKRWLPPQWSKCRWVLMTTSTLARSKSACFAQWSETWVHVGHRRVQLRHAGVDEHARIRMVDDVHVDRHPLVLGEQIGHEDRGDGRRRDQPVHASSLPLMLVRRWARLLAVRLRSRTELIGREGADLES